MAGSVTFSRYLLVAAILAGGAAFTLPAMAADDGYNGVMAPAAPDDAPGNAPAATGNGGTPGYSGVVANPAGEQQPAQQFTAAPYSAPSQDLGIISMEHGIQENSGLKTPDVDFSTATHIPIKGKQPADYVIGKNIEQAMASINNKNISDTQRSENARKAYQSLSFLADGLRAKQNVPDKIYKQMGLSDAYINDERTGNDAALSQLDAALTTLRPYQQ